MRSYIFINLLALALVEAYLVSNLQVLDKKCNVYFNITQFSDDIRAKQHDMDNQVNQCMENYSVKNLTNSEKLNCTAQCKQLAIGYTNSDGSLNSTLSGKLVANLYKKYSNGSDYYVRTASNLFIGCVEETHAKIKSLIGNQTFLGECASNGMFVRCVNKLKYQLKNVTPGMDWCGVDI